jgi:hypothetical protein
MRSFVISIAIAVAASAHAGEIIDIHDIPVPKVMPKPTPATYDPLHVPAYSSDAILEDVWVRTWLLLDIDAHGKVLRFKFLNHPGYGLEPIAIAEAFRVSFSPALDNHDKPTEAFALWKIEWPSHDYLYELWGSTQRLPEGAFRGDPSPIYRLRCQGSGPLNLTSVHATLRDCRSPDISKVDVEPWVYADGHREAGRSHDHVKFVDP